MGFLTYFSDEVADKSATLPAHLGGSPSTDGEDPSIITLENIQTLEGDGVIMGGDGMIMGDDEVVILGEEGEELSDRMFRQDSLYRKSSRRLKERIVMQ